jgi:Flp pilus assembly pilin Flp
VLDWSQFRARNDGGVAIEYALASALVAVALIASLTATGASLEQAYGVIGAALASASGGGAG